jgi:predicted Zn finger-like uncharacterized protein
MRVVCDNCGATYKIPEHKLVREVNKATCRRCGHGIIIRKPGEGAAAIAAAPVVDGESTQITSQDELEARARAQAQAAGNPGFGGAFGLDQGEPSDEIPATVVEGDHAPGEATMPRQDMPAPPPPNPTLAPPPPLSPAAPARPVQARGPSLAPPPPAPAAPAQPVGVAVAAVQPAGHDPSGDLALVLMGSVGAIGGALLMAVVSDHTLEVIGLAIALASGFTSLLVLLTGDRGRKEASVVLSMGIGIVLAGVAAGAVKFSGIGAEDVAPVVAEAEAEAPRMGTEIPKGVLEEAVAEAEVEDEEPDALEDALRAMEEAEAEAVAEAEIEEEEPEVVEPKSTTPVVTPKSRTPDPVTPKSSGSSVTPKSRDNPTTSSSSANVGVPVTVLDTMLKSNKGVKRCFGLYRQETGSLPKGRITVKLTVQPSGKASAARIDGGAYAGTSLDSCLGDAVKSISFPPWDGSESATYYYPFIL